MRTFAEPISAERRREIVAAAQAFFSEAHDRRNMLAEQFAMDGEPQRVVATEAEVRWPEGRMRVAHSKPEERPPFEWTYEITSDIGEADYFKHYLIRDNDIVLAQRKDLTVIDEQEAMVVLTDLADALKALVD